MKYIMVRLDNWDRTLVQEGWQNTGYSMEQELCMTKLDWVDYSNQSVWYFCIKLDTRKEHWKLSVLENNNVVLNGKQCWEKTMEIEKVRS